MLQQLQHLAAAMFGLLDHAPCVGCFGLASADW
jgi:hypothetical protein